MKPMLAAAVKDLSALDYPILVSPKYDGIRAIVLNGVVLSRSLKPIPNAWVQQLFGREEYNGYDGELIVGPSTAPDVFNKSTSGVMSRTGTPDVKFYVFDDILCQFGIGFENRLTRLGEDLRYPGGNLRNERIIPVAHQLVYSASEAERQELWLLQDGYEGMMLRKVDGPYKHGRSTLKEGYLLKLKRFEDGEAIIFGMTELMHNANEIELNELGEKQRSGKKDGKSGKGTMGALFVKDVKTGIAFDIGTGFTEVDRAMFWGQLGGRIKMGSIIKYKFQAVGVKDKPRFPVYLGLRDWRDMS